MEFCGGGSLQDIYHGEYVRVVVWMFSIMYLRVRICIILYLLMRILHTHTYVHAYVLYSSIYSTYVQCVYTIRT